jgi:hypothetical protein
LERFLEYLRNNKIRKSLNSNRPKPPLLLKCRGRRPAMAARPAQMGQCAPARFGGGHRASGVGCDVAPSSSQVHGMLHGLRIGHCRQPMEPLGKVAWAGAYPKGGGEVSVIITDVGVLL